MKKLESINYHILTDAERRNLSATVIESIDHVTPDECKTTFEIKEELQKNLTAFRQAAQRTHDQEISSIISEADAFRDEALAYIVDTAELYQKKRNDRYAQAAQIILHNYEQAFASVNINSNSEESEGIVCFLELMLDENAQDAAAVLRITDELEMLADNHTLYVEKFTERAHTEKNDDTPLLKPARRDMRFTLNVLECYLNFKSKTESDFHMDLIERLNGNISEIMSVARARNTRETVVAE